jgi:protein-tyrosine phosphatase
MGRGWWARVLRVAGPVMPGPGAGVASLSWIGEERIAVGGVPAAGSVTGLAGRGVTHVVNCRSREEARMGGDLAAERTAFGAARVAHAPMRDLGLRQRPRLWAQAALFAARVLDDQPAARVLIHCTAGRRRSPMIAYAVLRLRGRTTGQAASLVLMYRPGAELVPAYIRSVEEWLAQELTTPL